MKFSDLQKLQRKEGITVVSSDDRIERLEARLATIAKERDTLRAELDAPSVPKDVVVDYLVSISAHVAHQDDIKAQAELGELLKMLAAAPKQENLSK